MMTRSRTPVRFKEDATKFRELVLYVADQCKDDPRFGAIKLNKLLFKSEFLAYGILGRPITGEPYRHLPRGPVPRYMQREIRRLQEDKDAHVESTRFLNRQQKRLVPDRKANVSVFSHEDLAIVDQVIDEYRDCDATTMSYITHAEMAWRTTPPGKNIPWELAFVSNRKATPDDERWAHEVAKKYGWSTS